MTNTEAIEALKLLKAGRGSERIFEAIDYAIKAIKKQSESYQSIPEADEPDPIPIEGFPSLYAQGKDVGYKRAMEGRDKWFAEEVERRWPEYDDFIEKFIEVDSFILLYDWLKSQLLKPEAQK
jgi:hypothetical protein